MPSLSLKLERWRESVGGRDVRRSTRPSDTGTKHICQCVEAGETVVLGVGASPEDATKDACDKLWAMALAAAAPPTNPRPRWTK